MALLGFELLRPGLSPWLFVAPLVAGVALASLAARRRARRGLADPHQELRIYPGFSPNRARARAALATSAVVLLLLALLGPVRGFAWRPIERRGLDLVVCLDTSRSMLVEDLGRGLSRLKRARQEVRLLLERLKGDRVALVAFSGDVRDVAPLTRDYGTLRWFLDGLSPLDNRKGGTDVGAALEHALELFDDRSGAHEAIVLITDGEDLEQRGLAVAQDAAQRGIRVFVLGMGTAGGGKIPDGERGFVRDERGEEVLSKLDSETLEAIASATRGAYVDTTTPLALEKLHDRHIATLEGRAYEQGKEKIPHDRYQWPLVLALVCMLIEVSMPERRPRRRRSTP